MGGEAKLQEKDKQLGVKVPCWDMLYLTPEVKTVLNVAESEDVSPTCSSRPLYFSLTHSHVCVRNVLHVYMHTIDHSSQQCVLREKLHRYVTTSYPHSLLHHVTVI